MQIFCPSCQRQLRVADTAAGKTVKCPACHQTFTAGVGDEAEQIQAPVAPRPTVARPQDDSFERGQRSRGMGRDDDGDDITLRDNEAAQRAASAGAAWLIAAAVVALVAAVSNIVMTIALGDMHDIMFDLGGGGDEEMMAGMICGISGCGAVILSIVVMMIVAGLQLRSFGTKGWVITGIVLAFGLTLFFGGGALINLFYLFFDTADALDHWAPLTLIFDSCTAFICCFAGVKAIITLNHPAVSMEFDNNRHRRRRRRVKWQD